MCRCKSVSGPISMVVGSVLLQLFVHTNFELLVDKNNNQYSNKKWIESSRFNKG